MTKSLRIAAVILLSVCLLLLAWQLLRPDPWAPRAVLFVGAGVVALAMVGCLLQRPSNIERLPPVNVSDVSRQGEAMRETLTAGRRVFVTAATKQGKANRIWTWDSTVGTTVAIGNTEHRAPPNLLCPLPGDPERLIYAISGTPGVFLWECTDRLPGKDHALQCDAGPALLAVFDVASADGTAYVLAQRGESVGIFRVDPASRTLIALVGTFVAASAARRLLVDATASIFAFVTTSTEQETIWGFRNNGTRFLQHAAVQIEVAVATCGAVFYAHRDASVATPKLFRSWSDHPDLAIEPLAIVAPMFLRAADPCAYFVLRTPTGFGVFAVGPTGSPYEVPFKDTANADKIHCMSTFGSHLWVIAEWTGKLRPCSMIPLLGSELVVGEQVETADDPRGLLSVPIQNMDAEIYFLRGIATLCMVRNPVTWPAEQIAPPPADRMVAVGSDIFFVAHHAVCGSVLYRSTT